MKISKYYRVALRYQLNKRNRKALKNSSDFSLLCNNCVGGIILHELGQRFNSPTVNLFIGARDYLKLLSDLEFYLAQPLTEIETERPYPVGALGDITLFFMHYDTFEEAKNKWLERASRIKKENLFVLMVEQSDCTQGMVEEFDCLQYEHKAILVSKAMDEIRSAHYIKGAEAEIGGLIDICRYRSKVTGRRWLDDFDYVTFLNGNL